MFESLLSGVAHQPKIHLRTYLVPICFHFDFRLTFGLCGGLAKRLTTMLSPIEPKADFSLSKQVT